MRRATSPVISTMFVIVVIVVGGAATYVVLDNSSKDQLKSAPGDATLGSAPPTSVSANSGVDVSVVKFAKELNDSYYTSITIEVEFNGPETSIYVFDVDIFVNGIRLDDYAEWEIVRTDAEYTSDQGVFTGYKQDIGTKKFYDVNLTDSTNVFARLQSNVGFTYEVAIGNAPGEINSVLSENHLAVNVFSPVTYNISVIHYKQEIDDPESPLAMIINMIKEINGSNKVYFKLDNQTDVYDSSEGFNGAAIAEKSDLVISAEWAVNKDVADEMRKIYLSKTPMFMFGSVLELADEGLVDNSTTYELTGVWYTPQVKEFKKKKFTFTGDYSWATTSDYLLQSLSGTMKLPGFADMLLSIGTYDKTSDQTKAYGVVNYEVAKIKKKGVYETKWSTSATLLARKSSNSTVGEVITAPIDERILDNAERDILIRNVILSVLYETQRLNPVGRLSVASHTMEVVKLAKHKEKTTEFNIEIQIQVLEADLPSTGLQLTYTIPEEFKLKSKNHVAYVTRDNAAPSSVSFKVKDNEVTLSLEDLVTGNLLQGETITILLTGFKAESEKPKECEIWKVGFTYQLFDGTINNVIDEVSMFVPYKKYPSPYC